MRRILNLNQPGIVFVKMIGLFIVVIPVLFYCILLLLNDMEITGILLGVIRVSFAIGILAFVVLLVLIAVEQIQDHYIDVQYQKNRGRRLPLVNGNFECQYCGNQNVKENDKNCPICGKELNS
jgi:hypothetical protein